MKIRFFPIAQVLVAAYLMHLVGRAGPGYRIESDWNTPMSVFFVVLGFLLVLAGGFEFRRHGTTVSPIDPARTSSLVTSGIYRYSRNPMYVGFVSFLIGWVVYLGSPISAGVIPLFIWYITRQQIVPEENSLEQKFGDAFRDYRGRVRRWL